MRAQQTAVALFAVGAIALEQRDIDQCTDYFMSVSETLLNVPTPDPTLVSALASETDLLTMTDACNIPEITGEAAKGFTSYMSEVSSWYNKNSAVFSSLLEACSDVPELQDAISALPSEPLCSNKSSAPKETGTASAATTAATGATAGTSGTATETGSDSAASSTPTAGSSGNDGNAAGRMVVAMGAGLAAVGAFVVAL